MTRRLPSKRAASRLRTSASSALVAWLVVAGAVAHGAAPAADPLRRVLALPEASLLVEERGRTVIARAADRPMIPASTLKLVTALAAIDRWGLGHRFHTDFYRDREGWLWVKGSGDPYIVSEDLDRVAAALAAARIGEVRGIGTDDSLYAPGLDIPGRSATDNPYDAPLSALAVNFNTVHLQRTRDGVRSAEPQTPLTPLARELGQGLRPGTHRVNLVDRRSATRYFAELLAAKLRAAGLTVGDEHREGRIAKEVERVYRYESSRDLGTVLASMLEYSNNFVANGLFLRLADTGDGHPLTLEAAQRAMAGWVDRTFGWKGYRIEEGAGLSRGNRISARQLLEVLHRFAAHRHLLEEQQPGVRAKTGTLTGVSCYAGYVARNGGWEPFSLLINRSVPYGLRLEVAEALVRAKDLGQLCPGGNC
jgi:D-alanyl-D-alanine carboxypeptidase/D-alanyl-D-alanine-endopeptidase (penicillin-binding protein 4)